jgi:hypothetical protein
MRLLERLRSFLSRPAMGRYALILAVLVGLPSLRSGLMLDDYAHIATVRGEWPVPWWDLFRFLPGDTAQTEAWITRGPLPWWTDPEVKIAFFRPLSAALIKLDVSVFGERYALFHLHSLAWAVAWVAAAGLLFRRLMKPAYAGLALFLFAVAPAHWSSVYWLAARNSIVASVFVLLALWAYVRCREGELRWGAVLCTAFFAVGLLASEAALGGLGYWLSYELHQRRRRWGALAALSLVAALYLGLHRALGYGTVNSGFYADPLHQPLEALKSVPLHAITHLGTVVLQIPSQLGVFDPRAVAPQIIIGVVSLAIAVGLSRVGWSMATPDERHTVSWLALGGVLAVSPGLFASPGARVLAVASFGFAAVVAFWIVGLYRAGFRKRLWAVLALHAIVPPFYWLAFAGFSQAALGKGRAGVLGLALTENVVLLTASDPPTGLYFPMMRQQAGLGKPTHYWPLSLVPTTHRLTRVDARTLDLEIVGRRFLDTPFERIFRRRPGPEAGDRLRLDGAEVLVMSADDGHPTRIRFAVPISFEASHLSVVAWTAGRFEHLEHMPIGETKLLAR